MLQFLLNVVLGFSGNAGGFYLAYVYITNINKGSSPFLLLPSILFISVGIYFLVKASNKSASGFVKAPESLAPHETPGKGFSDVLKENDKLAQKWNQTEQLRTQLKMLQVSAEEKASGENQ